METDVIPTYARAYLEAAQLEPGPAPRHGPAALAWIAALQRRHLERFTFNSIGVILGRRLSLETPDLLRKVAIERGGGYCFEHNKLFAEVLKELGYSVRLALARVLLNRPIDAPLTHRVSILELDGRLYLVDVGFGPLTPREPLLIDDEAIVRQDGHPYQIVKDENGDYLLRGYPGDEPFSLYAFSLNRHTEADCELGHFYSSRHPKAVFVNNLVVSRILATEVRSLRNLGFRRFDAHGFSDTAIADAAMLRAVLRDEFEIELDADSCGLLFAQAVRAAAMD